MYIAAHNAIRCLTIATTVSYCLTTITDPVVCNTSYHSPFATEHYGVGVSVYFSLSPKLCSAEVEKYEKFFLHYV